jgi:hypothetical protein
MARFENRSMNGFQLSSASRFVLAAARSVSFRGRAPLAPSSPMNAGVMWMRGAPAASYG